jgi:SAM-dependent methyltransferase
VTDEIKLQYNLPKDIHEFFEIGDARAIPRFKRVRCHMVPDVARYLDPYGTKQPYVGLNLGAGVKSIGSTVELDWPEWDGENDKIPYPDESVCEVFAINVLEHFANPILCLQEIQRVLHPGGIANIVVPYAGTMGDFRDLDHRSHFTEETWDNTFNNPYYAKGHEGWKWRVEMNVIMGVNVRNLRLFTQLVRET